MQKKMVLFLVVVTLCQLRADVFKYLNTARIAYYNEKDYDRARKACLEGIAIAGDNVELLSILGGSEIGLGNWGAASRAFDKAFAVDTTKALEWIARQPEGLKYYFQSFYFFGRELFEQGEYAEVLYYLGYDAAFGIDDINVHVLKGAALKKLERFDEANNEYLKVLRIDPQNPDVNDLIGKSLFDTGDYDGCLSYFATAVKYYTARYERFGRIIFQNLLEIDSLLAQKIVRMWAGGEKEDLDRLLADSLKIAEGLSVQASNIEQFAKAADDLGRTYYYGSMAHYNLKNDTMALKNMLLSVRYKPDDIDGLYYAGEMNVKLEQYKDAIPFLERLVMLYPDDKYGWFYLGVCYTGTKQYMKAVDAYEGKLLKIDPENIDVMNNLAYVYREMGENEKALHWLIRAEELRKENKP
jgi:tetratricopeptide (TPR) repeat protein